MFMVILYFLGGEDLRRRECREINQRAIAEAGGCPRIMLVPWATPRDKVESLVKDLQDYYCDELGAREVTVLDKDGGEDRMRSELLGADLVYLPEGNARMLQRALFSSPARRLLEAYQGVIIGNAEGAQIMCRHSLLLPDQYSSSYTVIPGLDLVDFGVIPRYNREMDSFVAEASSGRTVFGVPVGSAVLYGAGIISHMGEVAMFKQGKRTTL